MTLWAVWRRRRALRSAGQVALVLLAAVAAKNDILSARADQADWERDRLERRVEELESVVWRERETVGAMCLECGEGMELCSCR